MSTPASIGASNPAECFQDDTCDLRDMALESTYVDQRSGDTSWTMAQVEAKVFTFDASFDHSKMGLEAVFLPTLTEIGHSSFYELNAPQYLSTPSEEIMTATYDSVDTNFDCNWINWTVQAHTRDMIDEHGNVVDWESDAFLGELSQGVFGWSN